MQGYVKFLPLRIQDKAGLGLLSCSWCLSYIFNTENSFAFFIWSSAFQKSSSIAADLLSHISRVTHAHFAVSHKQVVLRELFYVIPFVCHLPLLLIILAVIFLFAVVKFPWYNQCLSTKENKCLFIPWFKRFVFLGSSVSALISSVSEQRWHFRSSQFLFHSNSLSAQETERADSFRQLSAQVPWAGRQESCWGYLCHCCIRAGHGNSEGHEKSVMFGFWVPLHSHRAALGCREHGQPVCTACHRLENSIWFSQHVLHGLFFLPNCSLWDKPGRVKKGKSLFFTFEFWGFYECRGIS